MARVNWQTWADAAATSSNSNAAERVVVQAISNGIRVALERKNNKAIRVDVHELNTDEYLLIALY